MCRSFTRQPGECPLRQYRQSSQTHYWFSTDYEFEIGGYDTEESLLRQTLCWGQNSAFLSVDMEDEKAVGPTLIEDLDDVVSVSAGEYHGCAVLRDKTVRCWAGNGSGQLGIGTDTLRSGVAQPTGL